MSLISSSRSRARVVDRLRELDLLLGQRVLLVVREELREDQQRVERRAQLVAHVREELALVLRARARAARPSPRARARAASTSAFFCSMRAFCSASSAAFSSSSSFVCCSSSCCCLEQLLGRLQRPRLLLELLVRPLELVALRLQLLGLALQLLRQALRLLQQLLRPHRRDDRVQRRRRASPTAARGTSGAPRRTA